MDLLTTSMIVMHLAHHLADTATTTSNAGAPSVITQIATGLAAVLGAYSAYKLSKRNADSNDLSATKAKLAQVQATVKNQQEDIIDLRRWIFTARQSAAQQGFNLPEPPTLRSTED